MAIGKNKKLGKKGHQKKQIDPLSRKEWYDFRAPVPFRAKPFGKTLVTRTTGTKIASDQIKGRVVEYCLADLVDEKEALQWRKIRLILDEVEGHTAKTSFYGMDTTADKLNSMIRKWQSLIECFVDVKSADGYLFRVFVIAFTKRQNGQIKKKAYASSSHVREIRKRITNLLNTKIGKLNINDIVKMFTMEKLTEEITKECKQVFPLQNVTIRKVKVIKRPKIDVVKLNEMYQHEKYAQQKGAAGDEDDEAQNTLTKSKRRQQGPRREGGENRPRRQNREGGENRPRREPREGGDRPNREQREPREGGDRPRREPREGGERRGGEGRGAEGRGAEGRSQQTPKQE